MTLSFESDSRSMDQRKLSGMYLDHSPELPAGRWEVVGVLFAGAR
jgi:hypothetical protein